MSKARQAFEAWQRFGSKAEAARQLGIPVETLKSRINSLHRDPAIQAAQSAIGTDMVPQMAWVKRKDEDGTSYSVLLKPERAGQEPEDILDSIAERMNKVLPAPAIHRPKETSSKFLNFLPLFDVHLSMRVGDYGTREAVERLITGSSDILERLPSAECTIILNGGDFTHQNDPSNLTPASQHPLPVDMEYDETTDVAVDVTAAIIEKAATLSDRVIYQPLRGNHDPNTARILRAALKQRYRKNDRIEVLTDNIDFFVREWKGNFLAGHHGDKRKSPEKMVMAFAARYPEIWGRTRCRELYAGHLHSVLSVDVDGMRYNRIRAICPMDRHSIEDLWQAESEMIGITYQEGGGRHASATHYFG